MQLTRLKLNHFRGVKPGTELHFGSRFNVLLGVNATGKTTLLELIAAILADDFSAYAREAFDVEFELGTSFWRLHWPADWSRENPPIAEIGLAGAPGRMKAVGLQLKSGDQTTLLVTVANQRHFRGRLLHQLPLDGDTKEAIMMRTLEAPGRPLDEGLDTFRTLVSSDPWVPIQQGSLPLATQFEFSRLLETEPFAQWKAAEGADNELLNWALGATRTMGFEDAVFSVQKQDERLLVNGLKVLDGDGHYVDYRSLSYGQKRLFAFHAYLARTEGPIVIDELTNGLHHKWIDLCVQKLSDRQSFLSSHAPLLLDKLPWDSVEDVERMFIRCERNGREFVWRNLTHAEAEELHLSKEQGIESTSEILAREGLW